MNFLVVFWIIYIIGSFIFSLFAPKKREQLRKSLSESKDAVEKFDKEQLRKNARREANIQKRRQNTQALKQRHRGSHSEKSFIKDQPLEQLTTVLSSVSDNTNPQLSSFEGQEIDDVDFYNIADYDDFLQEGYDSELESAEQYLNELEDYYGDRSIEDASWMELDEQNILEERPPEAIGRANKDISQIHQTLNSPKELKKAIIINEIINPPLSLRD